MKSDVESKYLDGSGEYCVGNFAAAAAMFSECVAVGHARAATYLGQMHLQGEGVAADPNVAIELLEKGILWGDWNAAWTLAAAFYSGYHGLPRDRAKSHEYFLKAKELGCTLAIDACMGNHG